MSAHIWTFLLALWLISVSASGQQSSDELPQEDLCKTYSFMAPLGSSVLLPCNFSTSGLSWAIWAHVDDKNHVVNLTSNSRVQFLDPRQGRVKAFPNQASVGNFSILVDELKTSDLGSYKCRTEKNCIEVKLQKAKGALDGDAWRLIYICSGAAALILLCVVGYFYWFRHAGASIPPQVEASEHETGMDNIGTVYENDDQYMASRNPTRNQSDPAGDPQHHQDQTQPSQSNAGIYPNLDTFRFERAESHRRRQRFHLEIISRLRQASHNRHFYANQREINKQQAMAAQAEKDKKNCNYQNPIYNRGADQ